MTDFMKSRNLEEDMEEDRHLWRLGVDGRLWAAYIYIYKFLSWFLFKNQFPRVLRHSRLSVNDKGNNEMIPRVLHRSRGIYLTTQDNLRKPQLGDRLIETLPSVIA